MECLIALLFITFSCFVGATAEPTSYDVVNYGAVGDGRTDDTKAFLAAWAAACLDAGNPTVLVPFGKTFSLGPIVFTGPCKSEIHVLVEGNIQRPSEAWRNVKSWMVFRETNGLIIDGPGHVDGQGSSYWDCKRKNICKSPPNALTFRKSYNVELSGLKFLNSPSMHVVVESCNTADIHDITITSPENSPNTDGIHVQLSQNVQISHCNIGTGDDCVSLSSGTINANVSDITCGPGHGISIGSLGMHESESIVEQVNVLDSRLFYTQNGVRIKSWQGGSGHATGILFQNISLTAVNNPIIIDQYYCPHESCSNKTSAVQISDVTYIDIKGTTASKVAIDLSCSQSVACKGIVMDTVDILPWNPRGEDATSNCINGHGIKKGTLVPDVDCLSSSSSSS